MNIVLQAFEEKLKDPSLYYGLPIALLIFENILPYIL
jgi:hypothetical protein